MCILKKKKVAADPLSTKTESHCLMAPHMGELLGVGGWSLGLDGMSQASVWPVSCFSSNLAAWTTVSTCGMGTSYPPGCRPNRMLSI